MAYEALLQFIEEIGYFALFFALCLGLIGLPIPNEVVVLTAGAFAASGHLLPVPAFVLTYLGICSGLSTGYLIGRFAGATLLERFNRRRSISRFLGRSEELSRKYGGFAVSISLAFPLLRHVTPYAVGLNRMRYPVFAVYAYASALLWTLVYFLLGTFVGEHIREIGSIINAYGWMAAAAALAAAAAVLAVRRVMRRPALRSAGRTDGRKTPQRRE